MYVSGKSNTWQGRLHSELNGDRFGLLAKFRLPPGVGLGNLKNTYEVRSQKSTFFVSPASACCLLSSIISECMYVANV